jgi:hypothetical protein
MKLTIRPANEYTTVSVEVEHQQVDNATSLITNFYIVNNVRREALKKIKAKIHEHADSLTEDDLEII